MTAVGIILGGCSSDRRTPCSVLIHVVYGFAHLARQIRESPCS